MKNVKIYTEAGYKSSEEIGAFAYIVVVDGEIIREHVETANRIVLTINILELFAVTHAINWVKSNGYSAKKYNFYIYTDSQYVQLGANKWLKKRSESSKNKLYWNLLREQIEGTNKNIYIQLIDSQAGNIFHERAHELCTIAMRNQINNKIEVEL